MSLFSRIGEGLQQACNWTKEKVRQGYEWTKEKFKEFKEFVAPTVERIGERVQEWGKKLSDLGNRIGKKESKRILEPTDLEAAERAKETINEHFPYGIEATLEKLSEEERIDKFKELAQSAIEDLGLDKTDLDVQIEIPETEEQASVFGYFSRRQNTLFINAGFIVCDNLELVKEQVYTIYHELMHARQWAAICAWASTPQGDTMGYSVDRILEYANNYAHYTSPNENYERYRNQSLERDAYAFESELKEYNKE